MAVGTGVGCYSILDYRVGTHVVQGLTVRLLRAALR